MKKRPGSLLCRFPLFGLDWEARVLPHDHKLLMAGKHECQGICFYNERVIYLSDKCTQEQLRMTLAHEIQHAIEDHADVDYEKGVQIDVHDRWTDQVARGWVDLMRHCPEIIEYLRGKDGSARSAR